MPIFLSSGWEWSPGMLDADFGDEDRPYQCEDCGKRYRHKPSLGNHRRLECGQAPRQQCPQCPYKTWRPGKLRRHIAEKHPEDGIPVGRKGLPVRARNRNWPHYAR